MVQFSKLRLQGFKSFVDRTELEIGPGLNGIVGPNGCGKSNLVEALRWVMGENSAKRMRGDGMEDVIFAGTSKRGARNIAEVSLLLENKDRRAPASYNQGDEIEVIRRIERDRGSNYKINGRNVRARDVQMLFADTVTGANSPALVSQGHITRIINAKPQERRIILEESAGIAGLYARRHEAELRLKAADGNLVRVEDLLNSMQSRLASLKSQARQAAKYKNLNAQIRQLDVMIAYLEWRGLEIKKTEVGRIFDEAEKLVAQHMVTVSQLTKTQTTQAEDLPALRKREAEAAATLQTQRILLQRIDEDQERHKATLDNLKSQIEATLSDLKHEIQTLTDSGELLTRLEEEERQLLADQEKESGKIEERRDESEKLEIELAKLEENYASAIAKLSDQKAQRATIEHDISTRSARYENLLSRKSKLTEERNRLLKTQDDNLESKLSNLEKDIELHENQEFSFASMIETQEETVRNLENHTDKCREELEDTARKLAGLKAEIQTLELFFSKSAPQDFRPVLEDISADAGFEKALSRALGDSLQASLDINANESWNERATFDQSEMPSFPDGVHSILPHINAPKALHPALSQIGFVQNESLARKFESALKPGQSIVTLNGSYWRWDGYHIKAQATDRHALFLEQKNELNRLQKLLPTAIAAMEKKEESLALAQKRRAGALEEHQHLQAKCKELQQILRTQRPELENLRIRAQKQQAEIARLNDALTALSEDMNAVQKELEQARERQTAFDRSDKEDLGKRAEDVQNILRETRGAYQDSMREYDRLVQLQNTRKARLHAIGDERVSTKNRNIRARQHSETLSERLKAFESQLGDMSATPHEMDEKRAALLNKISDLEAIRSEAAEQLAIRENEVLATVKALKDAEQQLGNAREKRAHAQATMSAVVEYQNDMRATIRERFDLPPEQLPQHAALNTENFEPSDLPEMKDQREKLSHQRASLGAVNLRADTEADELEKEVTLLLTERNDLAQAVEELRGGIAKINKEARERLLIAFEHVNAHFKHLFGRLFGGGQAHLALIDSDDPLGAGLEVYAQPPGKSLQSLSLLSGGEQTLTSVALIFGMFLTNPSPICVLDEIDAPLDDANVDRVCDLLEEIAERGETRFLVITHHRLSMARMDRLYGVTMAERGVSQLVSVDLQQSFSFLDKEAA